MTHAVVFCNLAELGRQVNRCGENDPFPLPIRCHKCQNLRISRALSGRIVKSSNTVDRAEYFDSRIPACEDVDAIVWISSISQYLVDTESLVTWEGVRNGSRNRV